MSYLKMSGDHFTLEVSKIKALLEVFTILQRDKKICPFTIGSDGMRATLHEDRSRCIYMFLNPLLFDRFVYSHDKPLLFAVMTDVWLDTFSELRNPHIRSVQVYNKVHDHAIVVSGENKMGIKTETKIQVCNVPRQLMVPTNTRTDALSLEIPIKWFQSAMKQLCKSSKWITFTFSGATLTLTMTGNDDSSEKIKVFQLSETKVIAPSSSIDIKTVTVSTTCSSENLNVCAYVYKSLGSFVRLYIANDKELLVKYIIEHHVQDPSPQRSSRIEFWIANKKKLANTNVNFSEELFAAYRNESSRSNQPDTTSEGVVMHKSNKRKRTGSKKKGCVSKSE